MRTGDLKIGLSCRTLLLSSVCVVGLAGCFANVPHNVLPSPPSEEVRSHLGRVGMEVVGETPGEAFAPLFWRDSIDIGIPGEASSDSIHVSSNKLLRRLNQGGGSGAGSVVGSVCNASFIFCGAALPIAGAAAVADEQSRETNRPITEQEETAITKAFEQPFIQHTMRDDIVRTARNSGQIIQVFDSTAQGNADTILRIESVSRGLIGGTMQLPERKGLIFYMVVRVRLIQPLTKKELYAGEIEYLGKTMPLADWGANDAQRLREQFDLASHGLAEKIVETIFLLYRFPEPDLH